MSAVILGPLTHSPTYTALTLFREVACGFPSPAEPFAESRLSLDELIHLREPSMFLVRAMGESMTGAGVHPNDVIVVDRAREAKNGDIVVACLASEFTVKRLRLEPGRAILEPANPAYQPTILGDAEELLVWGVCTWNLHSLSP